MEHMFDSFRHEMYLWSYKFHGWVYIVDSGKFDWTAHSDKYPSMTEPEEAYHGLNFHETFSSLAFTVYTKTVCLRDIGACHVYPL